MRIYNPVADERRVDGIPRTTIGDLRGRPVVVLHNNKPNAARLLSVFAEEIRERSGAAQVRVTHKPSASMPAPDDVLRVAADGAGLVLTGTAD